MNPHSLQLLLEEIQTNIDDFKKGLFESEQHYQESLKILTSPELSSLSMEHHVIHIEQQREALSRMEILYGQVQSQLKTIR